MGLFDETDYQELLGSIIKIGEVSSVDAAAGTASVVFDDDDSIVVPDMQVIHRNTFANRDYGMPDIGEDVVCLFLPSGTEEGFILGSVYAGEIEPPAGTIDKRVIEFSDGARFEYDRAEHVFSAKIDKTEITADADKVEIKSGGVTFTLKDNKVTVDAQNIELGGKTTISGDLSVSGDISTQGDVKTPTVQLNTHMHLCAAPGATSGPPVMTPVVPDVE